MMGVIIGPVVTLFFCYLVISDLKKGVIATAVFLQLLSYLGTGIPGVKIFSVVASLCVASYFFSQTNSENRNNKYPRPLIYASILFIFSFMISEIYTRTNHHWGTILANTITYFIFPFVLWKCLDSRKNLNFFIELLCFLMMIALFWGILEIILKKNYALVINDFLFTLEDFSFDDNRIRFGLKRCNSIFSYFTTYGVACCLSFTVFYYMKFYYGINKGSIFLLIMTMPFCAFSTGSRAMFLGLFLISAALILKKEFLHTKYFKTLLIIVLLLFPLILSLFTEVYYSMADSKNYGDGSTSELRELQWGACLPYFLNSPWIGNGRMYIWDVVAKKFTILRGAESIWFSIMVDYGIVGALAFLNLLFMCGKCLWPIDKRLISIPIGYMLILSLSPDSGVQYNVLITFTIVHVKMYEYYGMCKYRKKDYNLVLLYLYLSVWTKIHKSEKEFS